MVLQSFTELLPFAEALGVKYQLRVLSHCIASQLRSASRSGSLSPEAWSRVFEQVESMLSVLEAHPSLALAFYNVYEAIRGAAPLQTDLEDLASDAPARIEGDLAQYVVQLAADCTRWQQQSDAHSRAYVERLRDEVRLEGLASRVQRFYATQPRLCVQMALLRVRLLYSSSSLFHTATTSASPSIARSTRTAAPASRRQTSSRRCARRAGWSSARASRRSAWRRRCTRSSTWR